MVSCSLLDVSKGEAEIGVIEKVNLTNFMCHDRLEVSLGPKLNFIIGHNGSEYTSGLSFVSGLSETSICCAVPLQVERAPS